MPGSDGSSTILPTLPDVCILYQLHLECGRWINLYDWYMAFYSVVVVADDDTSNVAEDDGDPKKAIQ